MKHLTFEWDDDKSRSNLRKRGISFDEAMREEYDFSQDEKTLTPRS